MYCSDLTDHNVQTVVTYFILKYVTASFFLEIMKFLCIINRSGRKQNRELVRI